MADKFFNREEAEAMLPLIEHCLNEARESKEKVEDLDRELSRAKTEIMVLGGSFPPYRKLATNRSEREEKMTTLQEAVERIQETGCVVKDLDEGLVDYLLALTRATRDNELLGLGVSPRGAMALRKAAQAYAFVNGRTYCVPDDIKRLAPLVFAHRVIVNARMETYGRRSEDAERILRELVNQVPVPL